jgi:RNA polymerase sigma-70 factor (ECF subfamily)
MRERSDEALMQAYAKGDMVAFETLYRRYRGPLYRFILRHTGDAATANDLYQGSWEKIIKARSRYRPSAPFRAWMYRIARNHVTDHFRHARPHSDIEPDTLSTSSDGPEQSAIGTGRRQALENAIARLPPEQREALLLRLEAGLDLQTIATVTGAGEETAKSRLRYAIGKLKKELAENP